MVFNPLNDYLSLELLSAIIEKKIEQFCFWEWKQNSIYFLIYNTKPKEKNSPKYKEKVLSDSDIFG